YMESAHDARMRALAFAITPKLPEASDPGAIRFAAKNASTIVWSVAGDTSIGGEIALGDAAAAGLHLDGMTVSSEGSPDLDLNAHVPPSKSGVFYRQAKRIHRTGKVVALDLCGQPASIGQAALTDYTWNAELALGASCTPPPASSLRAECIAMPCGM